MGVRPAVGALVPRRTRLLSRSSSPFLIIYLVSPSPVANHHPHLSPSPQIEHYSPATYVPQPLFNSAWDHPARAVDLTRGGQYGYWGADQTFIAVDADVSNLLGSCGYYRPTYY